MAKGDDIKLRKKNKALRKKLAKDPSSTSARVASIIASKKRRQSGKRRKCQGMCFSLPTQEDPFNETHGKEDISTSKRKSIPPQLKIKKISKDDQVYIDGEKTKRLRQSELKNQQKISVVGKNLGKGDLQSLGMGVPLSDCPSKFICSCLNTVQNLLVDDGLLDGDQDKFLFFDPWGVEFWKSYSLGNDMLESSNTGPSVQQIAWIASTAADSISQKENDGFCFTGPFMLYLVPSSERASKVRSVCRPLKAFGVHTVSLHPGTSVEHQVQGLKSCEPEFVIATPERLKELVLLKAVDISGVSLLVLDGMDNLCNCLDAVKFIKSSINGDPCTIVFQGSSDDSNVEAIQSILRKPFDTLCFDQTKS
ncbi:unnamed protein product [Amaranthus hypochondriacus]